jgi:hypothetical protein
LAVLHHDCDLTNKSAQRLVVDVHCPSSDTTNVVAEVVGDRVSQRTVASGLQRPVLTSAFHSNFRMSETSDSDACHLIRAAQVLFVTTKTVEIHLSGTYRKLGIDNRGELAGVL